MSGGATVKNVADALLEAPVFTSFTRLGYDARSRLEQWTPLDSYDLRSRVMLVTGATSGLGLVAAEQLARCGASVVLLGRNAAKTAEVRDRIVATTGNDRLSTVIADMGDVGDVRRAAGELADRLDRLDVLVHNAGALSTTHDRSPQGIERTIASQVVGPFLLTTLLLPLLRASAPARVLTMSSGGMYASALHVEHLQMDATSYKGSEQYARAKRAQVTLTEMWAERVPAGEVVFHALHPGWADTPGVRDALPTFRTLVGPMLRTPAQGADTLVWLAADDAALVEASGSFWHDRRVRSIHKLPSTRRSDTAERRQRLWRWVSEAAAVDDLPAG